MWKDSYVLQHMKIYLKEHGIWIPPHLYRPERNGVSERILQKVIRILQKIMRMVTAILQHASLTYGYWCYAAEVTAHICQNKTCKNPWHDTVGGAHEYTTEYIYISYFRVFGCICLTHIPKNQQREETKILKQPGNLYIRRYMRFLRYTNKSGQYL